MYKYGVYFLYFFPVLSWVHTSDRCLKRKQEIKRRENVPTIKSSIQNFKPKQKASPIRMQIINLGKISKFLIAETRKRYIFVTNVKTFQS